MCHNRPIPGLLILALLATACGSDDPGGPGPTPPEFRQATVDANPFNRISGTVTITALRYDSAFVRFWTGSAGPSTTPTFGFGGDSVVQVPLFGLEPASVHSLEINLVAGQMTDIADTVAFATGFLPSWIPPMGAQGADTTGGVLLLSFPDGAVVVDNTARVVWYRFFPNGNLNSVQAHANGRYTLMSLADPPDMRRFLVLDQFGAEVGELQCVGWNTRFHDLMVLEGGDYWILCNEDRVMDLSALGGVSNANVMGTVLQHVSPTGQILFEWKALDHFQITDLPAGERAGPNVNFTHGNGMEFDSDGNLLLSFRSLDEITKVDVGTGQVIWRLGGLANQFTFLNDPKGGFEGQHGVRLVGPGEIQLLDNGFSAPSRLVRYRLDTGAMTADLVWEFIDSPTTWTRVGGSTQFYPSGKGLVSFGRAGRVVEVSPQGTPVWELTGLDGIYVFRAQRIGSLYFPGVDPTR
ncbi:MAG: hypothetical protein HKM89_01020 [Gemmatimonadales bacterium]|nr:hypothetical protein [Gemmatimonadales bacterium]